MDVCVYVYTSERSRALRDLSVSFKVGSVAEQVLQVKQSQSSKTTYQNTTHPTPILAPASIYLPPLPPPPRPTLPLFPSLAANTGRQSRQNHFSASPGISRKSVQPR